MHRLAVERTPHRKWARYIDSTARFPAHVVVDTTVGAKSADAFLGSLNLGVMGKVFATPLRTWSVVGAVFCWVRTHI